MKTTGPARTPDADTSCPRCGYDQSGLMASWTSTCPLTGTCAECGLRYDWADVLNPGLRTPKWYVEASTRFVSVISTLLRCAIPTSLWRKINLSTLFRVRRLVFMFLATVFLSYLAMYAAIAIAEWRSQTTVWGGFVYNHNSTWWSGSASISGVHYAHLLLASVAPPAALFHHAFSPWEREEGLSVVILLIHFALGLPILLPLTFRLLPQSVRHCRVRPHHIVRLGVLACSVMVVMLAGAMMAAALLNVFRRVWVGRTSLADAMMFVPIVLLAWSVWFWASGVGRYLRMPHAWGVSILMHALVCLLLIASPAVFDIVSNLGI